VEEDSVLRCGEANDQSISHEDESETAIFKAPTTAFHFGSDRSDRSD
jgi:hypothetical protein